jgi:hypothetical protein
MPSQKFSSYLILWDYKGDVSGEIIHAVTEDDAISFAKKKAKRKRGGTVFLGVTDWEKTIKQLIPKLNGGE